MSKEYCVHPFPHPFCIPFFLLSGNQSRRPAESKGKVKFPTELPLFILMCFNLVARAATVTAVRSEHIDWAGQWLLIGIAKSKRQTHLVGWWFHCIANRLMILLWL